MKYKIKSTTPAAVLPLKSVFLVKTLSNGPYIRKHRVRIIFTILISVKRDLHLSAICISNGIVHKLLTKLFNLLDRRGCKAKY